VAGGASAIVCQRCGAIFRQGIDRFDYPAPAPGCRPGRVWVHHRPGQGRRKRGVCVYGDGMGDPRLSQPAAAVALAVPDDAPPDDAPPVVLAQAGDRRAA